MDSDAQDEVELKGMLQKDDKRKASAYSVEPGRKKRYCPCCTVAVKVVIFAIIGIALVVVGILLIPVFKKKINTAIKENAKLKNGTQAFELWHKPSPIQMNYYVFHLNNRDEVMKGGKPNVTEKGPYAYRVLKRNDPVHWSDNGNEVTYLQYKWYFFDPESSCFNCTPDDEIMTVNIPLMAIANTTKSIAGFKGFMVRRALISTQATTLFHKLKVKEILWGYTDNLLKNLKKMVDSSLVKFLINILNIKIRDINPVIQLQHNGTVLANKTGALTIFTGIDNVDKVQETYKWKGQRMMSHWKNPSGKNYGNMINGTDGTHFQPFLKSDDILYLFVPEICRSLSVNFDSKLTFKGIKLLRFTARDWVFLNASVNKANEPFCVPKCFKSGLLPVGQCIPMNPPVFMSGPHFYQGDPSLVDDIIGLHPIKEKHETFLNVEPLTGITMQAYKRLQVNLLVEEVPQITQTQDVRTMVFPIMYIDEGAVIGDADAAKFRKQVYTKIKMTKIFQYGLIAIGVLFFVIALFIGIYGRLRRTVSTITIQEDGLIQSASV